ncbi:mechanosensitive ion channel family protein [Candidatus Aalborgicola defluviihabitans]|uniref:mechanosensitive ion channel family protein n=1 Tax=Candidatus Aalborgicola defluviihabitans TaxID=3386187 RepID=UPI001DA71A62|nr:mechanosensitive ion channel family protein [Burkholderiales bacterium]MBK6569641.1 mechanosensitive ion channel family protein [Burkholderiales bacterium]MBK7280130.1 mechanosensitive ion channel family protein [Burkholderiales bacterium]MBK7315656.1 mechanosensitive ion channel family protein [Burkholderiales bacterium]
MDTGKISTWMDQAQPILIAFGLKALGAIAVFVIGRWLISLVTSLVGAAMTRQKLDPTVQRYLVSFISVSLNIILVVAILGYFGVETTSFAALVAGAGVAIGAAWSGLLGNFASGIFLLVLRPYQVGEYVMVGGIEGTVLELGLFGTTLNTPDNVRTVVGNGKVMGSDIKNYSANPYRRVELVAQLAGSADVHKAIGLLKEAVSKVPNLAKDPAVDVEILEFNEFGPKLAVRPYCNTQHYWQVYFDTNKAIADTLGAAGFPVATRPVKVYPG